MSTSADFTDAAGRVYLNGQDEPKLQAVGFLHRHPCTQHSMATVQIGEPFGCDCGGTVLIGWRDWWPLEDTPASPSIVIDYWEDGPDD